MQAEREESEGTDIRAAGQAGRKGPASDSGLRGRQDARAGARHTSRQGSVAVDNALCGESGGYCAYAIGQSY